MDSFLHHGSCQKHQKDSPQRLLLLTAPVCFPAMPPFAPACLSAAVRQAGHEARIMDLNISLYNSCSAEEKKLWNSAEHQDFWLNMRQVESFFADHRQFFDSQLAEIINWQPDCIGFSCWFTNANMSFVLARELKQFLPEVPLVLGGPEVFRMQNIAGLYADQYRDCIDLYVRGEGEEILPFILEHGLDFDLLSAQDWLHCQAGQRLVTPLKPVDLNTLATPDFTSLDLGAYTSPGLLPLSTSRGCVNSCIYCDEKKMWPGFRARSAELIFQDVATTKQRHPELHYVDFSDSLLNGNMRELRGFATRMAEADLGVHWGGNAVLRPEMDSELLDLMAKGGCNLLIYGLETVSKRVLAFIGKRLAVRTDLEKVIRDTCRAGIPAKLNFMFGLPGETEEDALENLTFVNDNRDYIHTVIPSFAFCNICPGTDAHDRPEEFAIKPNPNPVFWESSDGSNTYPVRLARFERFIRLIDDLGIATNYPYREFLQKDRMLAQYSLFTRNPAAAMDHLERALALEPDDAQLRSLLFELRHPRPAVFDMASASPQELLSRGEALFSDGMIEEAIGCFCLTLQRAPDHPEALNNLAVSYAANQEFEKAELLFRKCLQVAPYHQGAADNLHLLHELAY